MTAGDRIYYAKATHPNAIQMEVIESIERVHHAIRINTGDHNYAFVVNKEADKVYTTLRLASTDKVLICPSRELLRENIQVVLDEEIANCHRKVEYFKNCKELWK